MSDTFEIFVIGGGINGAGVARDASGRGYSVALAEMNDFASATSSSSTKLFHGGLRYLEYFEFRLVKEALIEREVLLKAMPHISWPMRFVLPIHKDMRFDSNTPTSRLLFLAMPWMKGRRPQWLIRLGLLLYDQLGTREILPGTQTLNLKSGPEGIPLKSKFKKAFEYSDCWIEDARLTLLNIKDAESRGAKIFARTKVTEVVEENGAWKVSLLTPYGETKQVRAKMLVNAGGPWVADMIKHQLRINTPETVRLVRGSHIVTKRLFEHEKCYFFQGGDGRIMFAIPYEEDYTLIGTTDAEHVDPSVKPECSDEEADYMIDFVNQYLDEPIARDDIVWSYSGVRPLYDDGASSASAATRDYVLRVDKSLGPPVLNIFGGKITTFRKLAESALKEIDDEFARDTTSWTATAALPGGDFELAERSYLTARLQAQLPFLDDFTIRRLIRQYGTEAEAIFQDIRSKTDLGTDFGHGVFSSEIKWAIANEWVMSAEDFLWRRSKMGLRFNPDQTAKLDEFIYEHSRNRVGSEVSPTPNT
jgi:glycerol-3-phosphate dehydrogenase